MSNKTYFVTVGIIIGLLIGLLLIPLLFFSDRYNTNSSMMGFGSGMSRNQSMRAIDRHFIEQMIPHHEDAIAMANLALQKSTHPEIKTLAQSIIASQTNEIDDMRVWYKNWYSIDVPKNTFGMMGSMMSGRAGSDRDIQSLLTATDFDKKFIELMIPHHQMAVMMARMLQSGTNRREMEQLAKDIIESQSKEIDQMQNWYQTWYK